MKNHRKIPEEANNYGQLGDGTTTSAKALVQVGTKTGWLSVSAGSSHTLAILEGALWAWGYNDVRQLGGEDLGSAQITPIVIDNKMSWLVVAAGDRQSLGITRDGRLWGWGSNRYGESGQPSTLLPHAVPGNDWAPAP